VPVPPSWVTASIMLRTSRATAGENTRSPMTSCGSRRRKDSGITSPSLAKAM